MPSVKKNALATGETLSKEETPMRTVKSITNGFTRLTSREQQAPALRDEPQVKKRDRGFTRRQFALLGSTILLIIIALGVWGSFPAEADHA
jgi:hypothetical protein